jgi:hypothetical protein
MLHDVYIGMYCYGGARGLQTQEKSCEGLYKSQQPVRKEEGLYTYKPGSYTLNAVGNLLEAPGYVKTSRESMKAQNQSR